MKITRITKNPYLLFSPFLCFYILYILLFPSDFSGDEIRYLRFAKNLIHGFYSPPAPDIDLTNGPGYPLLLSPFVAIGLPLVFMALLNAVFYYLSIILLFKALKQTVELNMALIFSCFWACYYVAFGTMNTIVPETFTFLLVSLLIFSLVKVFKTDNSKEIRRFIDDAYIKAQKLLGDNVNKLHNVAQGLMEKEKLEAADLKELFNRA